VVAGLALVDGTPLASHVFPGTTADKATLKQVIQDMAHRFGIRQIIFVADPVLHQTKGSRYYHCHTPGDGQFDYQVNEVKLAEEAPDSAFSLGGDCRL
jgi:hypothetical protein